MWYSRFTPEIQVEVALITRRAILLLATAFLLVHLAEQVRAAEMAWERLAGTWLMDVDATHELAELSAGQKERVASLKKAGVKIALSVDATGKTATVVITGLKEKETHKANWQLISEDEQGAVWESSTGGGAKKENVAASYLPDGRVKMAFADLGLTIVMRRDDTK
jgi:hypothetical protein